MAGNEPGTSAGYVQGVSFDEFVHQFNARAQIQQQQQQYPHQQQQQLMFQYQLPQTHYYGFPEQATTSFQYYSHPSTSNLTPTAAEFVPKKYQQPQSSEAASGEVQPLPNAVATVEPLRDPVDARAGPPKNRPGRAGWQQNRRENGRDSAHATTSGRAEPRDYREKRDNAGEFGSGWPARGGRWKGNHAPTHNVGSGRFRSNGASSSYAAPHDSEQREPPPTGNRWAPGKVKNLLSTCPQREKLEKEIESFQLECLVCCDPVKPTQSVWSCLNCFHILHLVCTTKWANSSQSEEGWRCPACQNISKQIPREYFCFCGKMKNPTYNRSDLAHSCGDVCERHDHCDHPCTLLCHPGPCPPCQAMVQRSCGCGKQQKPLQCSQKDVMFCEEICGKSLNCGEHQCTERCHTGACQPCEATIQHNCHCGKQHREVACTVENLAEKTFSCGEVCDHKLACTNHCCKKVCHPDACGHCVLSPDLVLSCPCGREAIVPGSRVTCLDPIPTCKGVCGQQLRCGQPGSHHTCSARCHLDACPPCNKSTTVKCRCGNMDQQIKCKHLTSRADDARCKKRCNRMRSCAKHKCNQECCIDIDHICTKTCSQMLSCGRHRCDKACHKGACKTCHRVSFDELACECGANVIYPPVPCGTKKPVCERPCPRRHQCDHPVLHNCHSDSECPPCVVLTTKFCFGKHEHRKTIPCYQESFSCGMACSKPLPCGRHKCIRPCHRDECVKDTDVCKQACTTTRTACTHPCNAPCHNGDCPETACKEMVEVSCECGNRKQQRTCHDFSKEYRRIASAQLASSVQEMQRGGSVELSDILGPIKPKNNKTLNCNEECRVLERNRRLAIGLQIRNPDLSSKLQPNYTDFLKTFAKKDPALIQMVHEKLTELVKLAKESKQKSRSYSFPVMNREKRHAVYDMCQMFGVEAVAYDAEPNRNIVATADRLSSWLPSMSLMEVMQRENGQRRIVVPNLNAWGRTSTTTTTIGK